MSGTTPVFVEWEEQIICHERGNRVTHFYLKCANGDSVLAVIGTERSVRHMMYVIPDQFLQVYGFIESVAAYKWRARREVVDWLTRLVSRSHEQYVQMNDSAQAVKSLEILAQAAGASANKKNSPDKLVSRKLKFHSSDIEWSGTAWFCAKQLKHYPGFCRNGTAIYVHSFVYVLAEEESHYLGYVEDMYEDKKRQKKVKVRWFHHSREVKHMIPQLNLQPGEVFITPHVQVISAECVNGPATVLTSKHYEKCLASIANISSSEVHMCCRQFKNNKIKPFTLSKLRGYSSQSVLSCLDTPTVSKRKVKQEENGHGFAEEDTSKPSNKRHRTFKEPHQVLEKDFCGPENINPRNQKGNSGLTYPRLKLRFSRKPIGIKVIGPKPQCHLSFNVDDKIELLCQDSGIRGCWFRCKVLNTSHRQLKIQYDDLLDVDGLGKLEEWVPACRVAAPDKLGMRCSDRLTVRPCPPDDTTDRTFEIGAPVDAWWSDGWWEGVVTAVNECGDGTLQIYLPGEEKFLTLEKKNIRISRDWVGNRWVDIPWKLHICSYLSSNAGSTRKLSNDSALVDVSVSDGSAILGSKLPSILKVKVEPKYGLHSSDNLECMKRVALRKLMHAIGEDKGNESGDESDDDTDKDSEEKLIEEENFDSAKLKLDAAEAVTVA